jgi:hypothetical protein
MRALGRGLAMLVFMVLIGLTFTLLVGQLLATNGYRS